MAKERITENENLKVIKSASVPRVPEGRRWIWIDTVNDITYLVAGLEGKTMGVQMTEL